MAAIEITVTERDIRDGNAGECETCPIALAVRRAMPGTPYMIWVTDSDLEFVGRASGRTVGSIPLPDAAAAFVSDFDDPFRGPVEPFAFELDVPAELLAAGSPS